MGYFYEIFKGMMRSRTGLLLVIILSYQCSMAQEGTVGTLQFKGLTRTRPSFIENLVILKEGMVLDSVLIEKDITILKRLPSIANASYEVFSSLEGRYDVTYTLEENFTLIPFANLFSSANDDFALRVGLQEFNFLGRNITLGGFYQFDVFNSYGLSVRAPNLFSSKWGLAVNYNDFTTQEPVFFDDDTADYRYNNQGLEVLGLYEVNFKNRLELGFSLFTEDYAYLFGATNAAVPQALEVDKHLYKLIYHFDTVTYDYQYVSGFKSDLNLQYVGSSDESLPEFWIGFNDFTHYHRVGQKGNWASRLRLGLASNIDSPFAPFTVDNNLNIRGVGNTIDRGTGAIVSNTEYRHTLLDIDWFVLQGNMFLDGGSWRNPGGDFGDFSDNQNIRIYPGLGLRFMHKRIFNAIFRIDYGYGITKNGDQGLVFGIGQYF